MKITRLQLQNFKNLSGEFKFQEGINLVVGPNGVGKTNLLEAIRYISTGQSFRKLDDRDLLNWNTKSAFAKVSANINDSEELVEKDFSFIIADDIGIIKKKFEIDNIKKKKSEYIYTFPSILFQPGDMALLNGTPENRRSEVNAFLKLISREYAQIELEYKKILRSRNQLLKKVRAGEASKNELDFWDDALITKGSILLFSRLKVLHQFFPTLQSYGKQIFSENFDELKFTYLSKVASNLDDISTIQEKFTQKIREERGKEILAGQTLYGPQRDDIQFDNGGTNLHKFGSRGQQRLVSLVFKLSMWKYYSDSFSKSPVLLLDDMMSELDGEHRKKLSEALMNIPAQIIFTSTSKEEFSKDLLSGANYYSFSSLSH